jgi:TolA-binding protein
MSDDLLKEATQALRDETADEEAEARVTRARVMASLHQGRVKRRTRLAFVLPIAACLAAGTAWGAATGGLPAMFRAIGQLVTHRSKPVVEPQRADPAVTSPPLPALPAALDAAPESRRAPSAPLAPSTAVKAAPAASSSAAPVPSSSAAFQDADGDLYRLAHEAHFAQQDYARALAGWDAYLRAAPGGRLATEARYNRAICLLRLGRHAEARKALAPFASGFMGYRQNEARELLQELAQ